MSELETPPAQELIVKTVEGEFVNGSFKQGPVVQEVDYEELAMQVAALLQQVVQSGDQIAMLYVNPQMREGFVKAFQSLPDEAVPPIVKEKLPIHEDAEVPDVQVITGSHMEARFLQTYFGPTAQGGNGKLEKLVNYLSQQPYPVRINLDTLRTMYVLDVMQKIDPGIKIASASDALYTGIRRP
jgi:hypothetical protein